MEPIATHRAFESGWISPLLMGLQRPSDIPLRLSLWNGFKHDFGAEPRVTVFVPRPDSLRHFVPPSLDNLAEGYVNGRFDVLGHVQDIIEVATRLARADSSVQGPFSRVMQAVIHTRQRDAKAIERHYDVSNEFYRQWLDREMVYSCAYFPTRSGNLDDGQIAKIDHILTKLMLAPGERLLDIGCGWGALAIRAAKRFNAKVVGVTLSREQYELARERVQQERLESQVEIRLQDYRDIDTRDGGFDKITSVGMFEHVGIKHLADYFSKINSLLKEGGMVLNHGITSTDPGSGATPLGAARFIDKYVFPDGELPHVSLALKEMQVGGLEVLDVECLRRHYERTLKLWSQNYETKSPIIRTLVDETTFRVWRIYLAGCAHAFAENWISLYQVLACKSGTEEKLNPTPWSRAFMYQ
jgi:cyclopropane-fatty-acyl-phospholipid synthase